MNSMFYFVDSFSLARISEAIYREDWSASEIVSLKSFDHEIAMVEENLWYPKPMELFRFLHDPFLSADACKDIRFHLENLKAARSIRLLDVLKKDSGIKQLLELPLARQMNILGHLGVSSTWIRPLHREKYPPVKSLIEKQSLGDDSRAIILDHFPIRLKRTMGSHGERTTLLFPSRTYPFPKVKVMALNENMDVLMDEHLPLDPKGRCWSVRFRSPMAQKYILVVRPLDATEEFRG